LIWLNAVSRAMATNWVVSVTNRTRRGTYAFSRFIRLVLGMLSFVITVERKAGVLTSVSFVTDTQYGAVACDVCYAQDLDSVG
jgi:hypothetical protein